MNTQIDKEQAITIMCNILRMGYAIPMTSIGNGGSGLYFVGNPMTFNDWQQFITKLKDKSFRIVPTSEISDEFGGFHFSEDNDVCVEFTNGDYSEQFLLWNINYFKD